MVELTSKRQELSAKFDDSTKRVNAKLKDGCSYVLKALKEIDSNEWGRKRTLLTSVKNTISVFIEGYEMCSSKLESESKQSDHRPDYMHTIVSRMPLSWIGCPYEEPYFEQFTHTSMASHTLEQQDKYYVVK